MHVHLPKPLHGWRAFVGEVGIIVVGVLIALGAEQIVETMSWRNHVTQARGDLRAELESDLAAAQERIEFAPCVARRMDQMDELIDHPPAYRWQLLPGHILVPIRVWSSAQWESALATGAVAHMRSGERAQYTQIYSLVTGLRPILSSEFESVTELYLLEHGGPLSEASQDRLRADVARIRGFNMIIVVASAELSRQVHAAGINLSAEDRRQLKNEVCAMPHDTLAHLLAR
jgi:hypothetical protein